MRSPLALVLPIALLACGGERAAGPVGGTVIIAAAADADALLPALRRTSQGRLASELLFDPLLVIGPSLNATDDAGFEPRLARRWSWSADSLAITFELDPDARWHDGTPVVGADVVAGLAAVRDPGNASVVASDFEDVDSVSAPDARRAVFHFRRRSAEQLYTASLLFPLPSHLVADLGGGALRASPFALAPVGSGPFRFGAWEPPVRLELYASEDHYRGRPRLDRVVLAASSDPASALARLWAGEADVWENLPPQELPEAARHPQLRVLASPGFEYGFAAFNFRDPGDTSRAHPLFRDAAMRRAFTLATDRLTIVRAVLDSSGLPLLGPFVRRQSFADTTLAQIPFDREAAAALFDSLGWRVDARDGIRRRGGRRLTVRMLVPASSANRMRAAVLLQEQWRLAGIDAGIDRRDNQSFGGATMAGNFDIQLGGWLTTPSARGLRGTWGSPQREGWGRQNYGRYDSPAFSDAVAAALGTLDRDEAVRELHAAFRTIVADAPAIWLYEAVLRPAVHARISVPAWRPDGWWRTIPEWSVDPAQRLPRDARPDAP
jgi:peptide/nickel transport system substrate-binding protein